MTKLEIRSLTGLRGIAAVFVVVFHAAGDFAGNGPAATFLRHGYNAVDLFFVLSGFVMALTYGSNFEGGATLDGYLTFLGRRIARIYPLYALVTLITFIVFELHLSHIAPISHPLLTLAVNLLGIQAWGFAESIVGPAWSISTEWGAYLAFPALAYFALSKPRWRPIILTGIAAAGMGLIAYLPDRDVLGQQASRLGPLDLYGIGTVAPFVRCLASFSLGLVAYRWRKVFRPTYSFPLLIILAVTLLLPNTDLLFVLVCTALIPTLASDEGIVAGVLGSPPVFTLGLWSYSIYILHARFNPVRGGVERLLLAFHAPAASWLAIGISTLAVIVCAALTYRYVETPGRTGLRAFFALRRDRSIGDEPSAP